MQNDTPSLILHYQQLQCFPGKVDGPEKRDCASGRAITHPCSAFLNHHVDQVEMFVHDVRFYLDPHASPASRRLEQHELL